MTGGDADRWLRLGSASGWLTVRRDTGQCVSGFEEEGEEWLAQDRTRRAMASLAS